MVKDSEKAGQNMQERFKECITCFSRQVEIQKKINLNWIIKNTFPG
jgi:hypothetical protein